MSERPSHDRPSHPQIGTPKTRVERMAIFPGVALFFGVLGVLFLLNLIIFFTRLPIPFAGIIVGAVFWLWVIWGIIGAVYHNRDR